MFEVLFNKYPFFRVIPAILCMAIIFKFSSMTGEDLNDFPLVWDKLAHVFEYALLCICFAMWWSYNKWSSRFLHRSLVVLGLTIAYGCTDELHQHFVDGRTCEFIDIVADAIGGLIGCVVYVFICKILNKCTIKKNRK